MVKKICGFLVKTTTSSAIRPPNPPNLVHPILQLRLSARKRLLLKVCKADSHCWASTQFVHDFALNITRKSIQIKSLNIWNTFAWVDPPKKERNMSGHSNKTSFIMLPKHVFQRFANCWQRNSSDGIWIKLDTVKLTCNQKIWLRNLYLGCPVATC